MRTVRLFLCICLCVIAGHSSAQDYIYAIGNPSFAVNIPVENGFINITNGNLHMEFPLATHKQRGALQLNERLVYDSRIWRILPPGSNPYYGFFPSNIPNAPDLQGGWRLVTGAETGTLTYTLAYPSTSYACAGGMGGAQTTTVYNVSWSDPSGTVRDFGSARSIIQDDCAGTYSDTIGWNYASDASGYLLKTDANGSPLILDNNGNQVYPQVIDRFGNYWSSDANGNLIDDVGRTPVIVTKNGSVTYYDVLAPNGPISNNGTRVRYTVTTAPLYVSTLFYQPAVSEWVGNFYPVQSIQLPDGSSYSFTYDSYGEMTSVTLPTGGVIHYGWTNFQDSYNNMNRWLTSRTVGSDPAMTFTPSVITQCASNGTGCQEKVVVHKPSGDETAYEMTLNNGAWNTKVSVYTGAASGTPIAITTNAYSFQCSGCGSSYITQSSSVTTLAGGLQSQQQYVFDAPWLGKPSALKEWDYYSGSPSTTPTRETDYSYSGFDLHQETVFGNGTQVAQTTYDYTISAATTSGISQHGTTNAGGPYLQKVTKWLNGGTSPYTTYAMDDTGMVTSITDPNQNPATTISYQCSNSLPYQTVNPKGHTTTYGYDCNSGAITSEKDPNDTAANRSGTTYDYEAVAGRLHSVTRPDSGVTTYSYPSSTEVDTVVTATPNPSVSSQDIVDSLGRPYQHLQAGVSTETTYDANGRPYCTTNPHLSSASSTDGSTCITLYDGLDRPKTQSQPDGVSSVSWDYSGNTVTFTDEAQHSWQRTSDAFGNLTLVIEPGGLKTSYQYNALGKLNCVDQWETNSIGTPCTSSRWRAFKYDSLSRLLWSHSTETGVICYGHGDGTEAGCQADGYDNNGNLRYKTDARSVRTNYFYDALNRLIRKEYTDGTPWAYFYYDQSSTWAGAPSNGIGRLTETQIGAVHQTDRVFSYDAMGRVTDIGEELPSDLNQPGHGIHYRYDLAGNPVTIGYPSGRVVTQSFDAAGRLKSAAMTGWASNALNFNSFSPTNVASPYTYVQGDCSSSTSICYTPAGGVSSWKVGNASQNFTYNNRLQTQRIQASGFSQNLMDRQYSFAPATTGTCMTAGNNGNIWSIVDGLNAYHTQTFQYDCLNRLTYASRSDGAFTTNFSIDSFGNSSPSVNGTATMTFGSDNRVNNLPCAGTQTAFDDAGNQLCDGLAAWGTLHQYSYDAESRVSQINSGNTSLAAYQYDTQGNRVRKDASGDWTEYVFMGGQPLSEKRSDGSWSDYIYANGKKVAKADTFENEIQVGGTFDHNGVSWIGMTLPISIPGGTNPNTGQSYAVIRTGDRLVWQQEQFNARGGMCLFDSNGTSTSWSLHAQDGDLTNSWHDTSGGWLTRVVSLDSWAGRTLSSACVVVDGETNSITNGSPSLVLVNNAAILRADGSVLPIYQSGQGQPGWQIWQGQQSGNAIAGTIWNIRHLQGFNTATYPSVSTTHYLADHLGSTSMALTVEGWPTQTSEFQPYGQEINWVASANHYKFTGQERDNETGLDHFMFRTYSSTAGRWMSADPYLGSMDLSNPQSLNRYAYVGNSPLTTIDPTGLDGVGSAGGAGGCLGAVVTGGANVGADAGCVFGFLTHWLFSGPKFKGSLEPRPSNGTWDEHGAYHGSPYSSIASMIGDVGGLSTPGCEFGTCGSGFAGPGDIELHHIFPQQFVDWFENQGIDIEKYLLPLTKAAHRLRSGNGIHTRGGGDWNGTWKRWIEENPDATAEEILQQGTQMLRNFGIGGGRVLSNFTIIVNPCYNHPFASYCSSGRSNGPI